MYRIEDEKYLRAKDRVNQMRKFYGYLLRSILAIGMVAAINYYQNEWEQPWFLWVVFGVGLGVFFKAIKVFGFSPFLGKNWEKRKIEQFMQEEERKERWQ